MPGRLQKLHGRQKISITSILKSVHLQNEKSVVTYQVFPLVPQGVPGRIAIFQLINIIAIRLVTNRADFLLTDF